jgi:hypothetical protein
LPRFGDDDIRIKLGHAKTNIETRSTKLETNSNAEERAMGDVVHTSRIKIVREKGPTRRAMIEGFDEPIYYGVHGGIKSFYKVEPEKEHAATLDHIVAATAG